MANPRRVIDESLTFVLEGTRKVVEKVDPKALQSFLSELEAAQRVFVYGTGRSGMVARAFGIRLAHLGFNTYVIGETITAPVHAQDLVILVSGSGETYPVVMTAEIARNIGARLIVLTAHRGSRAASFADVVIELASPGQEEERTRLAPLGTLFEVAAWLLLDGVVADLMHRRGQTESQMRQRHATLE